MSKFDEIDEFLDVEPVDTSKENKIEDVSANEEHLLTYALFPNIALRFFKNLLNK